MDRKLGTTERWRCVKNSMDTGRPRATFTTLSGVIRMTKSRIVGTAIAAAVLAVILGLAIAAVADGPRKPRQVQSLSATNELAAQARARSLLAVVPLPVGARETAKDEKQRLGASWPRNRASAQRGACDAPPLLDRTR